MKKTLFILLISSIIYAQNITTGLSFLKIGSGARNISMGDFGMISSNDLNNGIYNPSVIAFEPKNRLSFTHNTLFNDLKSELFTGSIILFKIPLMFGINTTNISDIEIRTKPGEADSKFDAHYFYGNLTTGFKIYQNIFAGVSFKYIYESLFSDDATGFGFDFGLSYKDLIKNLNAGISFRNIGSMKQLRTEPTKLPKDLRLGATYNINLVDYNLDINTLAGFQSYIDDNSSHFHFGIEINYYEILALRGGYITGYDSKNITAGFGILFKGINLDYAYVPYKYSLGDSHIITFTYTF
ncbi:PorV/PorQ family protein [Rosettibacter firmus]|uniref:PorV/PorQ family protein n=1 Tax=Rosettibacter firmus TaxID=3111522 RepID=UPI00336C2032